MLLCGADLVESFATPGVWKREHLQQIMGPEHGVVCIARCALWSSPFVACKVCS